MKASVTFRVVSDGREVVLRPDDVIGRMRSAALRINDPRISEAHAFVSLRGSVLKLMALRGRFAVQGVRKTEVVLTLGLDIELSADFTLRTLAVQLPERVLALARTGGGRFVPPQVASIDAVTGETVPGVARDGDTLLWSDGEFMHLRRRGEPDRRLVEGDRFDVGAYRFDVVSMPLRDAGIAQTASNVGIDAPVLLVLHYDSVHVQRADETVVIDGVPARILSELALIGTLVEWRTLAALVWPEEYDDFGLRQKWDGALARLRRKLREARLRTDLVRVDGLGRVELFLLADDRVLDKT